MTSSPPNLITLITPHRRRLRRIGPQRRADQARTCAIATGGPLSFSPRLPPSPPSTCSSSSDRPCRAAGHTCVSVPIRCSVPCCPGFCLFCLAPSTTVSRFTHQSSAPALQATMQPSLLLHAAGQADQALLSLRLRVRQSNLHPPLYSVRGAMH